MAFKDLFRKAGPTLLEPIMSVSVVVVAVDQRHAEVDDGEAGVDALRHRFHDALLDGGNVFLGDVDIAAVEAISSMLELR
jgi:hypothetical protein